MVASDERGRIQVLDKDYVQVVQLQKLPKLLKPDETADATADARPSSVGGEGRTSRLHVRVTEDVAEQILLGEISESRIPVH